MRHFLISILGFVSISFVALFLTDCICTKLLRLTGTLPYAVWNDIIDEKADANVLILGSSRAWTIYSPVILDSIFRCKAYNLGIDGSSFNRQLVRYEVWSHYYSKPELIIQNIDYCSTLDWTTGYMDYQYFPFFNNRIIRRKAFSAESYSFAQKYIPMYRYMSFGLQRMFTSEDIVLDKGYHGIEKEWDGSTYRTISSFRFSYNDDTVRLFSESLRNWRDEGIKVVMVFAPMYSGVTSRIENIDEMYALYQDMSREYDIPILDFNDDPMCSDTSLFYNATHLNKTGSELFSVKLAQAIDSLSVL